MATSSQNRAFQAYNSRHFQNRPTSKKPIVSTTTSADPLVFGRIPYSAIKSPTEQCTSPPSSPGPSTVVKSTPMPEKRCSSITSLSHLLPRQKSSQITALASQRQSLWINIAKNAQANSHQTSSLPFLRQQQTSLTRKKILRLLLVFSYLLSISLFAIALATFYGFFWTDYSSTQISNVDTPVSAILHNSPNLTIIHSKLPTENDLVLEK
ncbi:hypothetical protein I4U23_021409 [Adineta vaga]|nr:hypothetical protein I4U23_021409 [Adineta vaga]